jgi:Zn-dependent protease with chaperone function
VIYWRLAAAITFASFAAIVCGASVVSALTAPAIARRVNERAPASRAAGLFAMRLLPSVAALFGAFGIVLPMFLWFEPSDTQESVATTLTVVGAAGALLLARGVWRAVRAWRATRALARAWRLRGRELDTSDVPVPVFAIDETYPMVAVVGFRRPELFISERVLRACSADEVRAMVVHECAHIAARDNIKRFVLRACPRLLRANRALDRLWAHATEEAADAVAARSRPGLGTDLAHALVTVARLATAAHRPVPASALYLGGNIESRVRRLLDPAEPQTVRRVHVSAASFTVVVATIGAAVTFGRPLHGAIEAIVKFLP